MRYKHITVMIWLFLAILFVLGGCAAPSEVEQSRSDNEALIVSDTLSDVDASDSNAESAVQKAEQILSQFTQSKQEARAEEFAYENGYVLELEQETVNIALMQDFLSLLDQNKTAQLVVLKQSKAYGYDYVYLVNSREGGGANVTVACNPETVEYPYERYEQSDKEIILFSQQKQTAYLPLYIGLNGSENYTPNCEHQNWEHTIVTSLIYYVGEQEYLRWLQWSAQDSLRFGRCNISVYDFLKAFSVDYDTFEQTIGNNAVGYDLDMIKREVYPQYVKLMTTQTSPEEIGALFLENWMNNALSQKAEDGTQLLTYTINRIEHFAGDIEEFAVHVEFDYNCTLTDKGMSVYVAGNGEFDGKGTVTGVCREMRIKRVGHNTYTLLGMGTGGYGAGLVPVS